MSSRAKVSLVHHSTLAIVPPIFEESVWLSLQSIRYSLRDKGYYRWPPHINVVYPFIAPELYNDFFPSLEREIAEIHPFRLSLTNFNTFGGFKRGVLWLEPTARSLEIDNMMESEKIFGEMYVRIQRALDNSDIPLSTKPFVPHMTVCHCESRDDALKKMSLVSTDYSEISFDVKELVVMERRGDDGQFHIAWRLPLLGKTADSTSAVRVYERFPYLPEKEEDWVRDARLGYRARAKVGKGVYGVRRPSTDSPEVIALKRAERAQKRAEREGLGADRSQETAQQA